MPDTSTIHHFPPQLPVKQIATAAQALIDLLDALGGDPDLEDATNVEDEGIGPLVAQDLGPGCPVADDGDMAWVEWDKMAPSAKGGSNVTGNIAGRFNEDDEDDEGGGDTCGDEGEPDFSRQPSGYGAGCMISDPDYGAEEAGEPEDGI